MYFFLTCISCFFFRKIEIVQFASRTRQLFVRLLALVKWASNAGKVEKCAVCCSIYLFFIYLTSFNPGDSWHITYTRETWPKWQCKIGVTTEENTHCLFTTITYNTTNNVSWETWEGLKNLNKTFFECDARTPDIVFPDNHFKPWIHNKKTQFYQVLVHL